MFRSKPCKTPWLLPILALLPVLASASLTAETTAADPNSRAGTEPVAEFDDSTSVSWVVVPVTVDFRSERQSRPLNAGDFHLEVDGRAIAFEDFVSPHEIPRTLLFFQDLSGSMANGGKLDASRRIVRWFLERTEGEDEISLTTFASARTTVDVPLTSSQQAIEEHLAHWQAYGTTALYDAIARIPEVRLTASRLPSVVLITDGIDNASELSAEEAREIARSARAPVYVVGLGRSVPRPAAESSGTTPDDGAVWRYGALLRRLAAATGGHYVEVRTPEEVESACSEIDRALRSRYSLAFRLADGGRETHHSIRVTVAGRQLAARHRAGYVGTEPRTPLANP